MPQLLPGVLNAQHWNSCPCRPLLIMFKQRSQARPDQTLACNSHGMPRRRRRHLTGRLINHVMRI